VLLSKIVFTGRGVGWKECAAISGSIWPHEVNSVLERMPFWASLRARKLSKELSIRLPVRPIGTAEDALSWVRDRDVGVVLLELNLLTPWEAKRCADSAASGLLCDGGKSLLAWVGGAALPNGIGIVELTATLAAEHLDARLLEVVGGMFPLLRDQTQSHNRKRKMNIAVDALESAKVTRRFAKSVVPLLGPFLGGSSSSGVAKTPVSWPSCAKWMVGGRALDPRAIHPLKVGLGDPSQGTVVALQKVAQQTLAKAWEELRFSPDFVLRGGNLRPDVGAGDTSKIFVQREWRRSSKNSSKARLVWVADLVELKDVVLQNAANDLELYGVWCWIVSEGKDTLAVEPRIKALPDRNFVWQGLASREVAPRIIMLVGPDLHRYQLVYEALKTAAERVEVAETLTSGPLGILETCAGSFRGEHFRLGLPLVRAWLGLKTPEVAPATVLLGDPTRRKVLLAEVEEEWSRRDMQGKKRQFSDFQRGCIMGITRHVTQLAFIAGAGKTNLLMTVLAMARRQCPDMLTWVAAATNQVAQELKEEAAKYVPKEGLLYLGRRRFGDGEIH
jgi:hypothetical protein